MHDIEYKHGNLISDADKILYDMTHDNDVQYFNL